MKRVLSLVAIAFALPLAIVMAQPSGGEDPIESPPRIDYSDVDYQPIVSTRARDEQAERFAVRDNLLLWHGTIAWNEAAESHRITQYAAAVEAHRIEQERLAAEERERQRQREERERQEANRDVAPEPTTPTQPTAPTPPSPGPSGGVWHALAQCESGGNWSINTGNGFYGGLQFTLSSWRAVGGTGYPHQASPSEQIARGQALQRIQGWGAWPACASRLGLR